MRYSQTLPDGGLVFERDLEPLSCEELVAKLKSGTIKSQPLLRALMLRSEAPHVVAHCYCLSRTVLVLVGPAPQT